MCDVTTRPGPGGASVRQANGLDAELAALRTQVAQLRAENARLLRLLDLTPQQARPPAAAQAGIFDAAPGTIHAGTPPAVYLSSAARLSPRELTQLAKRLGQVTVGASVDRLRAATSTRISAPAPAFIRARLGAMITVESADLPPALLATLKHAASMPNPLFYERQRWRASTWDTPRFLRSYDETLAGDLVLPRGLLRQLSDLIGQAGSRLDHEPDRTRNFLPATRARCSTRASPARPPNDLPVHRQRRGRRTRRHGRHLPGPRD